jgi:ribosomal protein S21
MSPAADGRPSEQTRGDQPGLKDRPAVVLEPGQPLDGALKALRHRLARADVLGELKRREAARSPGQRRRAKRRRAAERARKLAARAAVGAGRG